MHTCDDISISEILYHYHDMENYIVIIDILIILHITKKDFVLPDNACIMNIPIYPPYYYNVIR